jgi:hypothetical protein
MVLRSEFYFRQMCESSFGMFRGDVGVACFTMLNGFFQMCVIASFKCEFLPPLSAKFSDFCACVTSTSA